MGSAAELVPPVMVICGSVITDLIFRPKEQIEPLVKSNLPSEDEEVTNNTVAEFANVALGWQAAVDLLYAFLASLGILACRAMSKDGHWLTFFGVIALIIVNVVLMVLVFAIGPSATAGSHFQLQPEEPLAGPPSRFMPLERWAHYFVIVSNLMIIAFIAAEMAIDGVWGEQPAAH
jgi:hypothetical protein